VPAMVRWPGRIKPGSIANDIFSAHDCAVAKNSCGWPPVDRWPPCRIFGANS
jgi:hypothetical protein